MADHRFAHGAKRRGQLLDNLAFLNAQLMVLRAVMLGDQVRILELVAALAAGVLETDGKG